MKTLSKIIVDEELLKIDSFKKSFNENLIKYYEFLSDRSEKGKKELDKYSTELSNILHGLRALEISISSEEIEKGFKL